VLYIGHFDFVEKDDSHHGYFTCVVEANNVTAALEKFRTLIRSLKEEGDLFDSIEEVYLDSCVEVSTIPKAGFLAHYVSYSGERRASISTSIRGAESDECSAYAFGVPDEDQEEEETYEVEPFISFE